MQRVLFATFGLDAGGVRSTVFAVEELNPDQLVLLSSTEARSRRGGALLEELSGPGGELAAAAEGDGSDPLAGYEATVAGGTYAGLEVRFPFADGADDTDDAEELQLAYRGILRGVLDEPDVQPEHAVADFTGGTKPMSAALYAAAYSIGIPSLNYVTGRRDGSGEVVPGTERAYQARVRRLAVRDALRESRTLFEGGDYGAARRRAEATEGCPDTLLPFDGSGRALLAEAGRALDAWERFRFEEALEAVQALEESDRVGAQFLGEHFVPKRRRDAIKRHLHRSREQQHADEPTYLGLAADLVNNAARRTDRGAHDDAIARLYRALEYLGQLRLLEEFELKTADFPVERLPGSDATSDRTTKIGMRQTWTFLLARDDALGQVWGELDGREAFLTALQQRNHSLLAHGFQPVDPRYVETLGEAVERLGREGWGADRWEELRERTRFPSLRRLDF